MDLHYLQRFCFWSAGLKGLMLAISLLAIVWCDLDNISNGCEMKVNI